MTKERSFILSKIDTEANIYPGAFLISKSVPKFLAVAIKNEYKSCDLDCGKFEAIIISGERSGLVEIFFSDRFDNIENTKLTIEL